jgi:hypothetical protein
VLVDQQNSLHIRLCMVFCWGALLHLHSVLHAPIVAVLLTLAVNWAAAAVPAILWLALFSWVYSVLNRSSLTEAA